MSRIIIDVSPMEGPDDQHVVAPLQGSTGSGPVVPNVVLQLDPRKLPLSDFLAGAIAPGLTLATGALIKAALSEHEEIQQLLDAQETLPTADDRPVLVRINTARGDSIPWETMPTINGNPFKFFALDPRCPIGRVAGRTGADFVVDRLAETTIRIFVVLSAYGCPALDQWTALHDALKGTTIDWSVRVFVGEPELFEAIEAESLIEKRIVVERLGNKDKLLQSIDEFKPNIIHFYCHGTAGAAPSPQANGPSSPGRLLFANSLDWIAESRGSIVLESTDLIARPSLQRSLWLIAINCCESGKTEGVPSFAHALVNYGPEIPAVLGMRERVSPTCAHQFCGPFYRAVFREIESVQVGQEAVVEWVRALREPRRSLASSMAENTCEWTVPVMYVRPEPFRLRRLSPQLSEGERRILDGQLDTLKKSRNELAATLPPKALAELEAEIRRIGQKLYATV